MKTQIVVIGLGRFGVSVATTLHSLGYDVLAIDEDEKNVSSVSSQIARVIQADGTSEAILKELGVADFDVGVVAMGSKLESSVLCTIVLKRLGVPYIIARANNSLHGNILEKIGADYVVYPEHDTGVRTAHGITLRETTDYLPVFQKYGIAKLPALPSMEGSTVSGLGFGPSGKWEVAVLVIQRKNEVVVTPALSELVKPGDVLFISGNDENIERLLTDARKGKKPG